MLTLPPQPTPFLGRAAELSELAHTIADPACRLVTILGPGGVGRTRLAVQLAAQSSGLFRDGVCFVPLPPSGPTEMVAAAILEVIRLPLSAETDPVVQLLNAMHDKSLLLVLDNFEPLLADSDPAASPHIQKRSCGSAICWPPHPRSRS